MLLTVSLSAKSTYLYIVQFWSIIITYYTNNLIYESSCTQIPIKMKGVIKEFLLLYISPQVMINYKIIVFLYIHILSLHIYSKYSICAQVQRQKTHLKNRKTEKYERQKETDTFKINTFYIEVKKK